MFSATPVCPQPLHTSVSKTGPRWDNLSRCSSWIQSLSGNGGTVGGFPANHHHGGRWDKWLTQNHACSQRHSEGNEEEILHVCLQARHHRINRKNSNMLKLAHVGGQYDIPTATVKAFWRDREEVLVSSDERKRLRDCAHLVFDKRALILSNLNVLGGARHMCFHHFESTEVTKQSEHTPRTIQNKSMLDLGFY